MSERIQGLSIRDYAFRWAAGGCPIQQWASGARGIDQGLVDHVQGLLADAKGPSDLEGLSELLGYLQEHNGELASKYIPDNAAAGYPPLKAKDVQSSGLDATW